jgi:pyruvate/2-oxoacid:ferredoxin oxidoreductase alpha subunit
MAASAGEGERLGKHLVRTKNHDLMVRLRQAKIDGISVPDLEVDDPTGDAELLLIGWGSSYGPIGEACGVHAARASRSRTRSLRHLNPFPGTWARSCVVTRTWLPLK